MTTSYPLIIFLYKEISDSNLLKNYLLIIESYIIRRYVCKLTTKAYNNLFLSILLKLVNIKEDKGYFDLIDFQAIFYGFSDETNLFPPDDLFFEAFHNSILSNQFTKELLFCIALFQKNNKYADVQKLSSSNYSVEHIMPKQWKQNWMTTEMTELDGIERSKKLLTLGNLTLVTKKLNSKLKNNTWENKKVTLKEYSSLNLTTDYLNLNRWDEEAIEIRSNDLFKIAVQIWPMKRIEADNPNGQKKKVNSLIESLNTNNKDKNPVSSTVENRIKVKIDYSNFDRELLNKDINLASKEELVKTFRYLDLKPKPTCYESKAELFNRLKALGVKKVINLNSKKYPI